MHRGRQRLLKAVELYEQANQAGGARSGREMLRNVASTEDVYVKATRIPSKYEALFDQRECFDAHL